VHKSCAEQIDDQQELELADARATRASATGEEIPF
jgi:hypothetical protein